MNDRFRTLLGPELTRLRIGMFGIGLSMALGFIGYQVVADADAFDALYQTIITISTVGFNEIFVMDRSARILTVFVILTGVISLSIVAVSMAEILFEGHLRRAIEGRRMHRRIEALRGHIIICGYGRVGVHVADALLEDKLDFVVIDNDPDKLAHLEDHGILHVAGDATEEQVLGMAGLAHASAVVAAVNSDADNVLVTITVKGITPGAEVIARAKADENEAKLKRAGADRVIAPTTIGGRRIAQLLTRPTVADFLDRVAAGGVDILLDEVPVKQGSDLAGSSLREGQIRQRYGCTIVAVRSNGSLDTHPTPDRTLKPGDVIVVMGHEEAIERMRADYGA